MKTILTLDKANQPYGFPQLNTNGNFNNIIVDGGLTATTISATTYQNLPNTLYTGDGTLSSNRTVDVGINTLNFGSSTYPNNLVLSGGSVGIGTSTPQFKLDVDGTSAFRDYTRVYAGAGNIVSSISWLGTDSGIINLYSGGTSTVQLNTNGVSYLNGGNVGIGITLPTEKLDVIGKTKTINLQVTSGATTGYVLTSDASGNATWQSVPTFTGGTINGLTATTISGGTLYGDGSNLTGLSTGLNVGTTQITNGTSGRVLFQSGTTLQQNSNLYWDSTNSRLSIGQGSSPQASLDVRAQGTLSTDIAFRVRNSGDTANLFQVNGDGTFSFPNRIVGDTAGLGARVVFGNAAVIHTQANHVNITGSRIEVDSAQTMLATNSGQNVRFTSSSVVNSQIVLNFSSGQIHLGGGIGDVFNGNNIFSAVNGTAPTSSLTDRFLLYSADRGGTAGRASAHFRSEDGTINVLGDRTGINTSTPQARLHVANADTTLTTGLFSGAGQNILTVIGSGNTTSPSIFTVQGSSGELFSVSDSLVGSLFSVNDISGLPVIEAFSDNTILMGSYLAPSLNTTARVIATTGTTNVYSIPTSAYTGAFFDYTVSDGTNLRAGNIMSIWSGTSVNITETQTTDFGNTSGLTFNMVVSSGNAILRTSGVTGNWTVKTIVRSI